MPRDILLSPNDSDYRPYDRDRSGSLSSSEMSWVPDASVAMLLENRLEISSLNPSDAADWLLALGPSKASRVLGAMDDRLASSLFRVVFSRGTLPALRILSFGRESFGEPAACHGGEAAAWLTQLAPEERRTLISLVRTFDPVYAAGLGAHAVPGGSALCTAALNTFAEAVSLVSPPSAPMSRPVRASVNRSRTTVVPMRAYALADAASRGTLLTGDVSTCTVLTLYDPARRIGVLAHFDVLSDFQNSLDRIFADLADRGVSPSDLVARVAGGNASVATSRRLNADLERRLALEGARVVEVSPDGTGFVSRSYVFDLATGDLNAYAGPYLAPDRTDWNEGAPLLLGRTVP